MRYTKKNPRLLVKFIDGDTDELLFEVTDRTWMNVGEVLSDSAISSIMTNEWKDKEIPTNIMTLVVGEFILRE